MLGVGGDDFTVGLHVLLSSVTTSIILSSNKIQNGDSLVSANPGPPGNWPLKCRGGESNVTVLCLQSRLTLWRVLKCFARVFMFSSNTVIIVARPLMLSPKRERKAYADRPRSQYHQPQRDDSTRLRQPMMQPDYSRGSAQNLMGLVRPRLQFHLLYFT